MSGAHTPTPWMVGSAPMGKYAQIQSLGNGFLKIAAVAPSADRNSNAAHIVKCVNAHDELVAALRNLIGAASIAPSGDGGYSTDGVYGTDGILAIHLAVSDARAVLAKVAS